MEIKRLGTAHLEEAMALVWKVFQEFEAPEYSEDGIQEFKDYITAESITRQLAAKEIFIWGCFNEGHMAGVAALRPPSHITLLFVEKEYHQRGIARMLINWMQDFVSCHSPEYAVQEITVNSSPYAVPVYRKLGFRETDGEQTVNGIRFVPMKMRLGDQKGSIIRPMREDEYYLLTEFLYEAIYQRDNVRRLPRTVIQQPQLLVFIRDFGQADDRCLAAEIDGVVVGAVWIRILAGEVKGFGNIDPDTPEFGISLYPEYRGRGIGSRLVGSMLELLQEAGYHQASLAVQKDNYALRMYQKAGMKIIGETDEEYLMLCILNQKEGMPDIRRAGRNESDAGQYVRRQ